VIVLMVIVVVIVMVKVVMAMIVVSNQRLQIKYRLKAVSRVWNLYRSP